MYRIDHIPQFIEPYHPWPVQNVFYFILLFTPKILFHFFPILVACINVFGVSPYIPLFRYMRILQKSSVISHGFFFFAIYRNGIWLKVVFDFLLS